MATKADGGPCGAHPIKGERWCSFHHPDRRAEHRRVSGRGGRRSWRRRLETVGRDTAAGALLAYLTEVMAELRRPGIPIEDVNRLRAATYAASVAVRVVEVAELAVEVDRLRVLVEAEDNEQG